MKELLKSALIDTIGECARRARDCKLSYLSLLTDEYSNDNDCALSLDEIEKNKKEVKVRDTYWTKTQV